MRRRSFLQVLASIPVVGRLAKPATPDLHVLRVGATEAPAAVERWFAPALMLPMNDTIQVALLSGDEEVSGVGYTRQPATLGMVTAAGCHNTNVVKFSVGSGWPPVTGFALYWTSAAGRVSELGRGVLTPAPVTVWDGDEIRFAPGDIVVTLPGG